MVKTFDINRLLLWIRDRVIMYNMFVFIRKWVNNDCLDLILF